MTPRTTIASRRSGVALISIGLLAISALLSAADPALRPIRARGIDGALFIAGGGKLPDAVIARFVGRAGGAEARLVVIPTASSRADDVGYESAEISWWKERGLDRVSVLHTRSRELANEVSFVAPLENATAVWIGGGSQSLLADAYAGTRVEVALDAVLARGGLVGGTSAGAAVLSRVMIARGNPDPEIATGFDLLPGAIVDQHFVARERIKRLRHAVAEHPGLVGVGVDEGTALLLEGRRGEVLGDSTVTIVLRESSLRPRREIVVKANETIDWTALRRAARARAGEPFPPDPMSSPVLERGSLVIVGGGGLGREIVDRFIALAGGPDEPIVVIPTAAGGPRRSGGGDARFLEAAGARRVHVFDPRSPEEADEPELLSALDEARGIWFGGGRQWRLVDAFEGTAALERMHAVLARGGVIGGSSAGASIQSEYMVRGHPLGNTVVMAEGYERGLGFLPGTAIDQHFSQRGRLGDLSALADLRPQLLAIGIDESTAIVVTGRRAEVIGRHAVRFYDRRHLPTHEDIDHAVITSGQIFDLVERRLVHDGVGELRRF